MQIIDNVIEELEFKRLQDIVQSKSFLWNRNDTVAYSYPNEYNVYDCQFTHLVCEFGVVYSPFYNELGKFFTTLKVDPEMIARVKLNCTTATHVPFLGGFHTDYSGGSKFTTYVFYLNTNNGGTKFKTGEFVNSIENRLVVFDGMTPHSGVTATDTKGRFVLNMNVITPI